ncbi:protein mono-ADP-ribosyltransferase PARP4 isoform X8 [Xenopus tropicalis]|uniref:Poly [ADP-ribose] polymerase n=1 Tax=Xenopus tropicalis TaxID=8364 RepID=A0A8J1J7Z5_XENTR|nr:protein mono-ADP-ribosyltransferase PARP4 isoform X8 [Xenopus tropicalis]
MTVAIFSDCVFFLKLNDLSFNERKALKLTVTSNGGVISFVLNQKCTHVVVNTIGCLSSSQQKNVQKHQIPIVDSQFIWQCLEKKCLIQDYQYPTAGVKPSEKEPEGWQADPEKTVFPKKVPSLQDNDEFINRDYSEYDADTLPDPPDAEVAKYCFFQNGPIVAVLELLCIPESSSFLFQISKTICNSNGSEPDSSYMFKHTAEAACNKYEKCTEDLEKEGFKRAKRIPPKVALHTSEALQKVLLEEAINATKLSPDVGYFVESVWIEALGHLDNILARPVNSISLNDVSKAEGVLLQVRKALDTGTEPGDIRKAMAEFYRLIPHKKPLLANIDKKLLSTKQDLCQLIRDMVSVCETNSSKPNPSSLAKYQALRCQIEHVEPNTEEFHQVSQQIVENKHCEESINILKIFRVGKLSEATGFQKNLGNVKSLLHASSPRHFVGILSRGLLLPKNVEDDLGLKRTDIGNLGSGIYFSDSISTSVKYSEPSVTNGARLLLVCEVALGNCKDLYKRDFSLTGAPSGFNSVHGVRQMPGRKSDFEDDEFVVYKKDQIKMRYAVQFCTDKDQVNMERDKLSVQFEPMEEDVGEEPVQVEDLMLENLPEPQSINGGLQSVHGNQIPLENIHVKGKMMDLVAEVILFQTYINKSSVPIEAKYVFPLDGTAAVCGFEAFINGKHVIGEVKEKEQAHKEYRAAISEGHGAYLMDQDAADVFTVSVGNLPPNATVIIKITYITELILEYGSVIFNIPGTVASWQKDKALKENTQDTVEKVCVEESGVPQGCFSLEMSVEMSFKIENVLSFTHSISTKKTDCKAVIATKKDSSLDDEGFQLRVYLESSFLESSWNQPRMWVEKHPKEDSEACMLVFLPSFKTSIQSWDLTILLDCSNSMESTFQSAKRIALLAASSLNPWHNINIISFGTGHKEFSIRPKESQNLIPELEQFIKMAKPNMGNTELWKPLQSLCLLAPPSDMHNVLLISDGHIQNESLVFQILKKNAGKVRLFTCGVGATANRHMLRCLAQYGAGFFEFFEDKSKSSWKKKMEAQLERMDSPACTSASVKWMQFSDNDPEPVQAPAHIPALFNRSFLLVYGFAPRCTQAKLQALIDDNELDTMVSTTELQKTRGTMLHKLTARAVIKDYEDGILHEKEHEHEMKKQQMKSFIIELSKKYSIVTQFTSFVAVEKRDAQEKPKDYVPNVLEIISTEDVDILPYMMWETQEEDQAAVLQEEDMQEEEEEYMDQEAPDLSGSDLDDYRLPLSGSDSDDYCCYMADFELAKSKKKAKRGPIETEEAQPFRRMRRVTTMCHMSPPRSEAQPSEHDGEREWRTLHAEQEVERIGGRHGGPHIDRGNRRGAWMPERTEPAMVEAAMPMRHMDRCGTEAQPSEHVMQERAAKPMCLMSLPRSVMQERAAEAMRHLGFRRTEIMDMLSPMPPSNAPISPSYCEKRKVHADMLEIMDMPAPTSPSYAPTSPSYLQRRKSFSLMGAAPSSAVSYAAPTFGSATAGFTSSAVSDAAPAFGSAAARPPLFGYKSSAVSDAAPGFGTVTAAQSSGFFCSAGFRFGALVPPPPPIPGGVCRFAPPPPPPVPDPLLMATGRVCRFAPPPPPPVPDPLLMATGRLRIPAGGVLSFAPPPPPPAPVPDPLLMATGKPRKHAGRVRAKALFALAPSAPTSDSEVKARIAAKIRRAPPSFVPLSALQHEEGYWLLDEKLGSLLNINVNYLIDVFLSKNGIQSLGRKGKEEVLALIATLLVLQMIRTYKLVDITFKSLMKLDESFCTSPFYQTIEKSVKWARKKDEQYPGICSRLGLGKDWESATRKLLSIDPVDLSSDLYPAVV